MQILFGSLILVAGYFSRLIRGTDMGTAYIFIMMSGVKPILVNPSSTGENQLLLMSTSMVFFFFRFFFFPAFCLNQFPDFSIYWCFI